MPARKGSLLEQAPPEATYERSHPAGVIVGVLLGLALLFMIGMTLTRGNNQARGQSTGEAWFRPRGGLPVSSPFDEELNRPTGVLTTSALSRRGQFQFLPPRPAPVANPRLLG